MMEFLSFDPAKKVLSLQKAPIPKPKRDEVLVRVSYCGVCGTDIHIMEGEFRCKKDGPFTLGHEFTGVIEAVGSEVTIYKVGQKVVIDPNNGCHKCKDCHLGTYHFCNGGGLNNTIGIYRNGGWATHTLVPEEQIHLVPEGVETTDIALSEPLSCLAHGWDLISPVEIGSRILILGAGIIGLLWASVLHLHGHRKIVTISEPQDTRRSAVKKLGLGYQAKSPSELQGDQYDLIIDCSGSNKAMEAAIPLLAHGGKLCVFGVAKPGAKMSVEPNQIMMKELTIVGVNINPHTFPKALSMIEAMEGKYLNYDKIGVKVFKLSEYKEAFEALKKGEISKAMFKC